MDNKFPWSKVILGSVALSTTLELVYLLIRKLSGTHKNKSDDTDVIFFPDKTVACDAFFSYGCSNKDCWLSHIETSSMKVLKYISSAERTLDICVYCIVATDLIDAVLKCQENGVVVRIITDQAQALEQPQQIGILRERGIDVRTNNSTFFMHHKFVIKDRTALMTGSFNWSKNAMLGNQENLLFLRNIKIVHQYQTVFEALWKEYE